MAPSHLTIGIEGSRTDDLQAVVDHLVEDALTGLD